MCVCVCVRAQVVSRIHGSVCVCVRARLRVPTMLHVYGDGQIWGLKRHKRNRCYVYGA